MERRKRSGTTRTSYTSPCIDTTTASSTLQAATEPQIWWEPHRASGGTCIEQQGRVPVDCRPSKLRIPGRCVNIPWPGAGMTDADYLLAFQRVVMPIAYEFAPDFVLGECAGCRE